MMQLKKTFYKKMDILCSLDHRPIVGEQITVADGQKFDAGELLKNILKKLKHSGEKIGTDPREFKSRLLSCPWFPITYK